MMPEDSRRFIKMSIWVERFWLLALIAGMTFSAYQIRSNGWEQERATLVIPAIAGIWWFFRRSFRKRLERTKALND